MQHAVEFGGEEGLRQVMLETGFAAAGAVGGAVASAHRDGQRRARGAEIFEQRPAVAIGQAEIREEQIARLRGQIAQRVRAGLRRLDFVPCAQQMAAEALQGVGMIFDDEDAHRPSL